MLRTNTSLLKVLSRRLYPLSGKPLPSRARGAGYRHHTVDAAAPIRYCLGTGGEYRETQVSSRSRSHARAKGPTYALHRLSLALSDRATFPHRCSLFMRASRWKLIMPSWRAAGTVLTNRQHSSTPQLPLHAGLHMQALRCSVHATPISRGPACRGWIWGTCSRRRISDWATTAFSLFDAKHLCDANTAVEDI